MIRCAGVVRKNLVDLLRLFKRCLKEFRTVLAVSVENWVNCVAHDIK